MAAEGAHGPLVSISHAPAQQVDGTGRSSGVAEGAARVRRKCQRADCDRPGRGDLWGHDTVHGKGAHHKLRNVGVHDCFPRTWTGSGHRSNGSKRPLYNAHVVRVVGKSRKRE